MFDEKNYCEACAHLTLGTEKLEELIAMTENTDTKKRLSRPMKTVLIAAACVAALCITAFAAPAVQKMFMSFTVSVTGQDGKVDDAQMFVCPDLALEQRGGRDILTVDGKEIDVTEAMEKDGYYEQEIEGATLRVTADGMATITVYNADGEVEMTYTVGLTEEGAVSSFEMDSYSYWEGETDENGDIVGDGPDGVYEVKDAYKITEQDGELVLTDSEGNVVDAGGIPQE